MNVSATFQGEAVNIVDIDTNGSSSYVTYVTSSNELKVKRVNTLLPNQNGESAAIATAVGIIEG